VQATHNTNKSRLFGLDEASYRRLATWAPEIAEYLSPGSLVRRDGDAIRIGRKGSLVVNSDGRWHSFEADEGGADTCSLLAFLQPDAESIEQRQFIVNWLRDHPGTGSATTQPTNDQDRAARHTALCRQVMAEIQPCVGTLAETYLASRALPANWPSNLVGYVIR
jgi:hypothetical protein